MHRPLFQWLLPTAHLPISQIHLNCAFPVPSAPACTMIHHTAASAGLAPNPHHPQIRRCAAARPRGCLVVAAARTNMADEGTEQQVAEGSMQAQSLRPRLAPRRTAAAPSVSQPSSRSNSSGKQDASWRAGWGGQEAAPAAHSAVPPPPPLPSKHTGEN